MKRGGDRTPDWKLIGIDGETTLHTLIRSPRYHLLLFSGPASSAVDEGELQAVALEALKDFKPSKAVSTHFIMTSLSKSETSYFDENGEVHGLFGFKEAGYALIRPDGHVEYIGMLKEADDLRGWLN